MTTMTRSFRLNYRPVTPRNLSILTIRANTTQTWLGQPAKQCGTAPTITTR